MCLACNPNVIRIFERCLNWLWAEVFYAAKWPAWRERALPGGTMPQCPEDNCVPIRMQWAWHHTLADRQDFASAKVSSPIVCIYHFWSVHGHGGLGRTSRRTFGTPFTTSCLSHHKTSFCPLVLTSLNTPVTQNPWKTARTKSLNRLIDPDILEE